MDSSRPLIPRPRHRITHPVAAPLIEMTVEAMRSDGVELTYLLCRWADVENAPLGWGIFFPVSNKPTEKLQHSLPSSSVS